MKLRRTAPNHERTRSRSTVGRAGLFTALITMGGLGSTAVAQDDYEVEDGSPYYEDDAWWDVSEWLDGNDYNPTNEKWWRIDSESYAAIEAATSDDESDYGYDEEDSSSFFYDYYDGYAGSSYWDDDDDKVYEQSVYYYDSDGDGTYDVVSSWADTDSDGMYDSAYALSFGAAQDQSDTGGAQGQKGQQGRRSGADQQGQQGDQGRSGDRGRRGDGGTAARGGDAQSGSGSHAAMSGQRGHGRHDMARQDARAHEFRGEVVETKTVRVRNGEHLVAHVESQQGERRIVDLGRKMPTQTASVSVGDSITVEGPMLKVGDKEILLAKSVDDGRQKRDVRRSEVQVDGKVQSTRTAKVRGGERLLAVLESPDGRSNWLIDLGPRKGLSSLDLASGDELQVEGLPCRKDDMPVLVAQFVEHDGQELRIDRSSDAMAKSRGHRMDGSKGMEKDHGDMEKKDHGDGSGQRSGSGSGGY